MGEIFATAEKKGLGLKDCFQHFDVDKTGELTRAQFSAGLRRLGIEATDLHLDNIFDRFSNEDGKLRYNDFARLSRTKEGGSRVDDAAQSPSQSDSSGSVYDSSVSTKKSRSKVASRAEKRKERRSRASPKGNGESESSEDSASPRYGRRSITFASDTVNELAEDLRLLIRKAHKKGLNYRECFEHFDTEYLGAIDKQDFKSGLKKLGFNVSSGDLKALVKRFTSSERGFIKYRDFLRFVAPDDEFAAEQVAERFRAMLHEVSDLRSAFKHFARNRQGKITRKAFKNGLEKLHFRLSDSELRVLMDLFDQDMDNEISFDDFVNFAHSGDLGSLRESKKKGPRVTITVNQVKLASDYRLRNYSSIYVSYCFMSKSPVESPTYPVTGRKVKMEFRKNFTINSLRKLNAYMVLKFTLVGTLRNGEEEKIGVAKYDLDNILEQNEDLDQHTLEVRSHGNERQSTKLMVSTKALSVLRKL